MYIEETEVTASKISEIFESAFMDVLGIEGNKLTVKGMDFPFPLHIAVNSEQKSITFTDMNQLHRISEQDAALLCNELNKKYSFCRFYAVTSNNMVISVCEYDMTYQKGINPFHVVANFRWFEKIVGQSIREAFADHLRE